MLLIPYKKITLNINRSISDAESLLASRVLPRQQVPRGEPFFRRFEPSKPFEGVVENGRFNINRIIDYRRGFLPFLDGEFTNGVSETKVDIVIRPYQFSLVIIIAFYIFIYSIFLVMTNKIGDFSFASQPLIIIAIHYLIIMVFFNWEVNQARYFLETTWGIKIPKL